MTSPISINSINFNNEPRHNTESTIENSLEYYDQNKSENSKLNITQTPTNSSINTIRKKKKRKKLVKNEPISNFNIEPLLKFRVKLFDELIKIEKDYWNYKQTYSANSSTLKDKNRNIYTQAFFNLLSYVYIFKKIYFSY
jgi:hypothetical protein